MDRADASSGRRDGEWWLISGAVCLGVVLRFVATSDLWLDEALSVNIARLGPVEIASWLRHDGAPPLYYWLLWAWTRIFGTGAIAVRALSGIAAVASIGAAWFCAREILGARAARYAAAALALNPFVIRFATETRMYSAVIAAGFVWLGFLVRTSRTEATADAIVLALATATLLWLHYWGTFAVAAALAIGIFTWVRFPDRRRAEGRRVVALVAGGLPFVLWIPTLLHQQRTTGTPWGEPVRPWVAIGSAARDLNGFGEPEGWLLLGVTGLLVTFGALGTRRAADRSDARSGGVRFVLVLGGLTLLSGSIAAYAGDAAFQGRYAAVVVPMLTVAVAAGFAALGRPAARIVVLVALTGFGALGSVRVAAAERTQAGTIASRLAAQAQAGDVVVMCPDQLGPAIIRLLPSDVVGGIDIRAIPNGNDHLIDWEHYRDRVAAVDPKSVVRRALLAAPANAVWLVTSSGYATHRSKCRSIEVNLGRRRRAEVLVNEDLAIGEHATLIAFRPSPRNPTNQP